MVDLIIPLFHHTCKNAIIFWMSLCQGGFPTRRSRNYIGLFTYLSIRHIDDCLSSAEFECQILLTSLQKLKLVESFILTGETHEHSRSAIAMPVGQPYTKAPEVFII